MKSGLATFARTIMSNSRTPASSTTGKIVDGCFAIHKPLGISSAQVLRDLQRHFNPSKLFAPALAAERSKREAEPHSERKRRSFRKRGPVEVKIGHGGTLDPEATGVLIAGVGKGTKSLQSFLECTKAYECTVLFGAATDTYDAAGKVVARKDYAHITEEKVKEALAEFRGKIMQKPPIYSALRIDGKRLYDYAREGLELPRPIEKRPVEVKSLEMVEWMEGGKHDFKWPTQEADMSEKTAAGKLMDLGPSVITTPHIEVAEAESSPERKRKREDSLDDAVQETPDSKRQRDDPNAPKMSGALSEGDATATQLEAITEQQDSSNSKSVGPPAARITMTVTSGFYVRSFCHDLGATLGSYGLMSSLVRTRQADFELGKNVFEYNELAKGEEVWGPQIEAMLDDWNDSASLRDNTADPSRKPASPRDP